MLLVGHWAAENAGLRKGNQCRAAVEDRKAMDEMKLVWRHWTGVSNAEQVCNGYDHFNVRYACQPMKNKFWQKRLAIFA